LQHVIVSTVVRPARFDLEGLTDFNRLRLAEHYPASPTYESRNHDAIDFTRMSPLDRSRLAAAIVAG
jgi:hypothetical protein